jgi:uncharacterized membrane protein
VGAAWTLVALATIWTLAVVAAPFLQLGAIYSAAGLVCHQLPERTFHVAAGPFAVCARCLGLYAGALAALWGAIRSAPGSLAQGRARAIVAVAAAPTLVTLAVEWLLQWRIDNGVRFAAALPLGAAAAFVVASAMSGERRAGAVR